jgi:hypothetical protein
MIARFGNNVRGLVIRVVMHVMLAAQPVAAQPAAAECPIPALEPTIVADAGASATVGPGWG